MTHTAKHTCLAYNRQISFDQVYQVRFFGGLCEDCYEVHLCGEEAWGQIIFEQWFQNKTPAPAPNRFARKKEPI